MLPGSIVPWIPHDKSDPPKKWVICNGSEITTGPWKGQKTPNMTGHFLLGAKIDDVIVEANQQPGKANFNKNNPNAMPLRGSLDEADSDGYCSSKTLNAWSNSNSNNCDGKLTTSFTVEPQDIKNALDAYKVVYIMKVE